MIDVDVVLVNMDEQTAFCSDGVTRAIFEMYDADAQLPTACHLAESGSGAYDLSRYC